MTESEKPNGGEGTSNERKKGGRTSAFFIGFSDHEFYIDESFRMWTYKTEF